jgi:hypothetical protein
MAEELSWDAEPRAELYDQRSNFFPLSIEGQETVSEVAGKYEGDFNPAVLNRSHTHLALGSTSLTGRAVALEPPVIRDFVHQYFLEKLGRNGFAFKGKYRSYYKESVHPDSYASVFKLYDRAFEFRVYFNAEGRLFLIVDPCTIVTATASLAELWAMKVPLDLLKGFYVSYAQKVGQLAGYLTGTTLAGDGSGIVCSVRNGRTFQVEQVAGAAAWPEGKPELLQIFLDAIGVQTSLVKLHQKLSFLHSNKPSLDRLDKTYRIVKYLAEKVFPLAVGNLVVKLEPEAAPIRGEGFLRGNSVAEPKLVFDRSNAASTGTTVYTALRNYGPYDKERPTIRVLLVGPKAMMASLKGLVDQLNKGNSMAPGGMKQFFWTGIETVAEIELESDECRVYEEKCAEFIKRSGSEAVADVAIVAIPKTSEFLFDTPYYKAKAMFASIGLPTQMITPGTFGNLKWSFLNLATAIFAKAGGIPWVLEAGTVDFDLVVGLSVSNSVALHSRIGTQKKYMGYVNTFDEFGRWMFFEGTAAKPEGRRDERLGQIRHLLQEAIVKYQAEKNTLPKRISVHYYKRFSRREREAVLSVIAEKSPGTQVCLINLDDDHPMRLYDKSQPDGSFPRGGYAELSDSDLLLCSTGFTTLSQKRMGTPKILHASIQQVPETFVTNEVIARHLLGLTKLNYATLTPIVREPVSLLFSKAIARLASAMSDVEWNGLVGRDVHERMKTKMWFL